MVRVFPDKVSKGTKKCESRVTIKTAAEPIIMVDLFFRAAAETTTGAIRRNEKGLFNPPVKKSRKAIGTGQIGS